MIRILYLAFGLFLLVCGKVQAGQSASYETLPADSLIQLIRANYFKQDNLSRQLLQALYQKAGETKDPDLFVQAIFLESLTEYSQHSNPAPLANRIDSLLKLPTYTQKPYNELLLSYSLALARLSGGNFPEAFRHALAAYRLAVQIKDTSLAIQTASTIGNIGPYLQDYALSRHYYQIALRFAGKDTLTRAQIQLNLSRLQSIEGYYDSAIQTLRQAMGPIAKAKDSGNLAVCYLNLGSYFSGMGERDSAYQAYLESLAITNNLDNSNVKLLLYGNIGNYFRHKKDYVTAKQYYHTARKLALKDSNMDTYTAMAYELSVLFGEQGIPDSSYYYLTEYNKLISRIQQPHTIESYKNYVDVVMEASENQIKLSEQAVILKNRQLIIITITSAAIIITIFLLLLVMIERRRRMRQTVLLKEIENKELADQLEHEQQIQELQQEKMEQKLREISSYSLLLATKNNILSKINELCQSGTQTNFEENFLKIRRLAEESLHTDGDYWQTFVAHFVQIDPHFFENLKKRFPDLTPNETKLCAYIRIGMTSKQIASILNLSPESVNTNRYRIRKKHHLSKDEDLDEIIKGL